MRTDPRVTELRLLTALSNVSSLDFDGHEADSDEGRALVHLLFRDYAVPVGLSGSVLARMSWDEVPVQMRSRKWTAVGGALEGRKLTLTITHEGLVRAAELRDQLASGRIREPMGLIWDGRHFRRDAEVALLDVDAEHPLCVAFFDLNEVKRFNEKGHDVGDQAIRSYLSHVAVCFEGVGEAYRLSGGADEVIVLMPQTPLEVGVARVRRFLVTLSEQEVETITLRTAAGVVTAAERTGGVDALKSRADGRQSEAKTLARSSPGCPSCLAWDGAPAEVVTTSRDA